MRQRSLLAVLVALAAALAASATVYRVVSANSRPPKAPDGHPVLVAARDLNLGALIGDSDVRLVSWEGPVMDNWATRREDIVGRGVLGIINKGEPFPQNRLAPRGAGAGLAAVIPNGMRAVAVKVDEVVGVSGFVLPGMHVDVLSSGTPPGQDNNVGTVTRTILQNIEVLSAGQNFERDIQGRPATVQVVNLVVTPEQAESLSLASAQTKIQLVLRNPLDDQKVATPGISTRRLLEGIEPVPQRPPVREVRVVVPAPRRAEPVIPPEVVEVFHGTKKEVTVIREGSGKEQKQ